MTSTSSPPDKERKIQWIVRPATIADTTDAAGVLKASYENLLTDFYESDVLEEAMPFLTSPQAELLACGTWYLVQHPDTKEYVGCGGWMGKAAGKLPSSSSDDDGELPSLSNYDNDGHNDTNRPHLRHFATHPNWVRKGVAQTIWKRVLKDTAGVANNDATVIDAHATLAGQSFYESLGFKPVQFIDIPGLPNCKFPGVLMRNEL